MPFEKYRDAVGEAIGHEGLTVRENAHKLSGIVCSCTCYSDSASDVDGLIVKLVNYFFVR